MTAMPDDPPPAARSARPRAPGPVGGPARPAVRAAGDRARRRRAPLPVAAAVAATWAAVVSYAPVAAMAAIGALGSGSTLGAAARFALAGWLLGHGVPVNTATERVSLVPLTITALAAWRVGRAGVHASRAAGGQRSRTVGPAVSAAAAVGLAYAVLGAGAASLAGTADRSLSAVRAAVTLGCFGVVAAGVGALGHSRAARARWARAPAVLTMGARAGVVAAALVLAAGSAAAGVAVAVRGGEAAQMLGSYRAGILGQAGITTIGLAYAPNLAVWAAAYLLGPGFAVGDGTVVSPGLVTLGPVPAIPVLAGLPAGQLTGPWSGLLVLPPLAGAGVGVLIAWAGRRPDPGIAPTWPAVLGSAALAGPVAGVLIQLAAFASAGAVGSGQLRTLGPTGWRICLVATVMVGLAALVAAAGTRAVRTRSARVGRHGRRVRASGQRPRPVRHSGR